MRKLTIAALAAASILCMAAPAMAETFTASNGVLSIDLPNEEWKEVVDPSNWITLSDGANQITVEHFANGEKLPEITVADEHYVNVYQGVYSTQNEVFIITGSVVDAQEIPDICKSILSAKVLKYDTKVALKQPASQAAVSSFTVAGLDKTMYAASDVNLRSGYTTDDQILVLLNRGASVKVKGSVQKDGKDIGWYQVDYNGTIGYVCAQFLSDKAPEVQAAQPQKSQQAPTIVFNGNVKTIYKKDGSASVTIYQATDGEWYDNTFKKFIGVDEYSFVTESGEGYTSFKPQYTEDNVPEGEPFKVYWGNSNVDTLTLYSDGYYYSEEWVRYTDNHDGTFTGVDGTTLYDYDPIAKAMAEKEEAAEEDDTVSHKLINQETGEGIIVDENSYDDGLSDEEGNGYYMNEDGDYEDTIGNEYDMEW